MFSTPVILLAAGVSSRMKKPLTTNISIPEYLLKEADILPKSLLSVGPNRERFIEYILSNIKTAWWKNCVIVLAETDTLSESLIAPYAEKYHLVIKFARQPIDKNLWKPCGTGDAVLHGLETAKIYFPEETKFILTNSDNLLPSGTYAYMSTRKEPLLYCFEPQALWIDADRRSAFGLVISDGVQVLQLVEKPSIDELRALDAMYHASINVNCFTWPIHECYNFLQTLAPHPLRREKEITELFLSLIPWWLGVQIGNTPVPDMTSKQDIPAVQACLKNISLFV